MDLLEKPQQFYKITRRKLSPLKYLMNVIDFNIIVKYLIKNRIYFPYTLKELYLTIKQSLNRTDISDHLITLFFEALMVKPRLIVELGVRYGESTLVFERVAKLCCSILVSVDIEDCSNVCNYNNWIFVRKDDIDFAKEFQDWSKSKGINPEIDILFIDTSHIFEHTLKEIHSYFPFLSQKGKVIFHDTNLTEWDNERGVIRAIEQYLCCRFDEKQYFEDYREPFKIKHYPFCQGLTILEKMV